MNSIRQCVYCGNDYVLKDNSPDSRKYCYKCVPVGDKKASKRIRHKIYKSPGRREHDKKRLEKLTNLKEDFKSIINKRKKECVVCGYSKCKSALHFHHKNPCNKKEIISMLGRFNSIEQLIEEMDKCVVLCANCHTEAHYFKYDMDRY